MALCTSLFSIGPLGHLECIPPLAIDFIPFFLTPSVCIGVALCVTSFRLDGSYWSIDDTI